MVLTREFLLEITRLKYELNLSIHEFSEQFTKIDFFAIFDFWGHFEAII